jgi:hypothetical protein
MDGHDHGDLDVDGAEGLVGLVGLPPHLAEARDEQVTAVPRQPVGVQPQPPQYCLASITATPTRTDH